MHESRVKYINEPIDSMVKHWSFLGNSNLNNVLMKNLINKKHKIKKDEIIP